MRCYAAKATATADAHKCYFNVAVEFCFSGKMCEKPRLLLVVVVVGVVLVLFGL